MSDRRPYLMMPADFKKETIKKFAKLNNRYDLKVEEVYGVGSFSTFGSGRKVTDGPPIELDEFKRYINVLNESGMYFHYTLNASCNGNLEFTDEGREQLYHFVKLLMDCGVKRFTVTIPTVMEFLSANFKDIEITASVIYGADTVYKLKSIEQYSGVKQICLKEDLNRDFAMLKRMNGSTRLDTTTIVNSFCLLNCPMRTAHYNFDAHTNSINSDDYYLSWCILEKVNNPETLLRIPFIRPEDLKLYIDLGIKGFKIGGRESKNPDFVRTAEAYMRRSYDGNLVDLLVNFSRTYYSSIFYINNRDLDGRIERLISKKEPCSRMECKNCRICEGYIAVIKTNESYIKAYNLLFKKNMKFFRKAVDYAD